MASNNFYNGLRTFFGIGTKQNSFSDTKVPYPAAKDSKTGKLKLIEFPTEIQRLYDQWLTNTFDSSETLRNRTERYKDLDYMYYNSTVMSMATELYADETVQADAQSQVLQISAKDKNVERYIIEFFNKIGVTQKVLRAVAFDITLYGDHFWILPSDGKNGITEISPVDVYSCFDRLEFNAIEVKKKILQNNKAFNNLTARDLRLAMLANMLQNNSEQEEDKSKYFASYLFGYQFEEDIFLPPWNVAHFRRFTPKSEFFPFGRPVFINCISPFRQLQSAKNLMALARAYKFPKEHFKVHADEGMSPIEKWDAVNEAREEYQNMSINETGKDHFAVGGQVWSPEGLIAYDVIENNMSLDDIADIEMLRDDLIMGTRIPKGYLIVDRASFGTSGQALLQQFKPFGRTVFTIQSAILEELIYIVKLQFIMTGDYPEDTEFEIMLPFPVIEESADRLRMKSDTLRLANDILANLQSALGLGRDETIPMDIIKDIFGKYSFLDSEELEKWANIIQKKSKPIDPNSEEKKRIEEKIKERMYSKNNKFDEVVQQIYFNSKKRLLMNEGILGGRHYLTSSVLEKSHSKILKTFKDEFSSVEDKRLRENS